MTRFLKTHLPNRFVSLLLAAAVAVSGLTAAAPARAGDRDVARALAAIAGLAIIGAAVHDAQKDRRRDHGYVTSRGNHGAKSHRAHRQHKRAHRQARRQHRLDQAYREGYRAHRREVRDRRAERRQWRRAQRQGYGQQRYSARPYYQ